MITAERPISRMLSEEFSRAPREGLVRRRALECLAISMIGDGALAFVEPWRHVELWRSGPKFWQAMMKPFVDHPEMTRWIGAAGVAVGFWLASRQEP